MQHKIKTFGRRSAAKRQIAGIALVAVAFVVTTFAAQSAHAQTFTSLYSFPAGPAGPGSSGAYPGATNLLMNSSGDLIGTTQSGGDQSCNPAYGCGVVWVLSPTGSETVLHQFHGSASGDGSDPGGLVADTKTGLLYGLASGGGAESGGCVSGCGTVFSINSAAKETTLHSFTGSPDGDLPLGTLVLDPAGNLFGVTFYGGNPSSGSGYGTVFEVNSSGQESVFYSFTAPPDGSNPNGSLVRDSAGNLYGTTTYGGSGSCNNGFLPGCGIVFKVDSSGHETVLYNFTGGADGQYPGSLTIDAAGNLYGKAGYNSYGEVFKIDTAGTFSILYNGSFAALIESIILGPSGSFYGTATAGNSSCSGGCGSVFQLAQNSSGTWRGRILHAFDGTDGSEPDSLILNNGVIYGTTYMGGSSNYGTIFKLVP
jgi:uncharacterized repeat protein (TIGR03803 family)